jgi:hypothetical protein
MSEVEKLIAVTTQIGKQKAFDAELEGIKIKITHIAVGDGAYVPHENQTSLENEKDRVPILSSKIIPEDFTINFGTIIDNNKTYWVNEIGFYLEDGTLFSVWCHPTIRLGEITEINKFLFGYSLQLVDVGLDKIEVIDMGVDLTLNYSKEFLDIGLGITRLSNVVLNLNDKVKQSVIDCDELTKAALIQVEDVKRKFNETLTEFKSESFKKTVIDWQTFEYVCEIVRQGHNTGIMSVNQTVEGLKEPYKQPLDIRYSPVNAHVHFNYYNMPGSGQFAVNANGTVFQTRHNDYRLFRPKQNGSFLELESNDAEAFSLTGSISEQIEKIKSLYNRFLNKQLLEDEKKHFRYSLSYVESYYEIVDDLDGMIDDGFDSFRHTFGQNSSIALAQKAVEFRTTGKKARFENYPYLPVVAKIDKDGIERYVVVKYRICSIPIPSYDGKVWEEIMEEKEDIISEARFGEIDVFSSKQKFALKNLDSILEDIPGLGGYSENITKKTPDGYTITSPANGARYHRNYTIQTDAVGRANYTNGWNDPTLIVAYTDNEAVLGGVSTFVPLEIILHSPVQNWNPYEFEEGSVVGMGTESSPFSKINKSSKWYRTPAELYNGYDDADKADTGNGAKWVLDANQDKHLVVASGVSVLLPKMIGVEERIRMRYPVYYTAHEYSPANIALSAARKKIQEMSISQASAITSLQTKEIEEKLKMLTQLSMEEIEEVLKSLQKEDYAISKKIKEQRDDLLLPILSNTNGLVSIQNILINKKLN